ncbi:hypothetical protein QBC36DRAFT_361888 [Triangularia setosa]|uniref:Uncharacterized protein n=1 Tax=Triangularia setosa TaxID=2587417 RepID=A0AAN6VZY7_9PEZI|nr:hypothetical protein QBC36DRAFT_361888 [Podospora setosa]
MVSEVNILGTSPDTIMAALEFADLLRGDGRYELAENLQRKGYATAREFEEKAFETRARILGEHHHFTLRAKDDIAITMAKQGDFLAIASMHEEVRSIRLVKLGALHPQTLETERILARRRDAELERARKLNEDILWRAIKTFGKEYWDTDRTANVIRAGVQGLK